ncbi:MAG: carboxypeptidase-like regulatory domain-containing protein [Actinomycetota bacterium]|nr:carboxypeptidase-like regulatory domain-containing protein [Actinomycetota bacterium]
MYIALRPTMLEVVAGSSATIEIAVIDPAGGSLDGLCLVVAGVEPAWVRRSDGASTDAPLTVVGDRATAVLEIAVPVDHPSVERLVAIGVRSSTGERGVAFERLPIRVVERPPVRVTTDPSIADGRSRVEVSLVVSSEAARDLVVIPVGDDSEGSVDFDFERARLEVPAGADRTVGVRLRGGRPIVGRTQRRTVQVGVDAGERVMVDLPVVHRPLLPSWLLAAATALLAVMLIVVFTATSWLSGSSTSEVSQPPSGPVQVIDLERPGAVVSGRVTDAVLGDPVAGLVVELFSIVDPVDPVAVSATDVDGRYSLIGIGQGSYTLRAVGAGFVPSWLGDVERFDEAAAIDVGSDDVDVVDLVIEGVPGRVLGRLSGTDLDGVVVQASTVDGASAVVSAEVSRGTGGVFELPGLATPARHRLTVIRGDRELTAVEVDLGPGAERGDVTIVVPPGDGVITGTVTTAAGPLGGVAVTITDGATEVTTSTLSLGAVGTFAVDGLELPGRYTVTVARDGFAVQSAAVDLTAAQPSAEVLIEVAPATGSITGRVVGPDGAGVGGVTVRATSDGFDLTTVSVDGSDGTDAGRFVLGGLPAPGTFTLTLSADGYVSRSQEISLVDASAGPGEVTASLVPATAMVSGVVTAPDGSALSGATVTLSDGVRSTTTRSADDPAGVYEFVGVAPGSHTVTVRVAGAAPVVVLVEVSAGESISSDIAVGESAMVTGRVVSSASGTPVAPVVGTTVRLFPLARFPGSNADAVATVLTGVDGSFTLTGFDTPGDYVVAVASPSAPTTVAVSVTVRPSAGTVSSVGDLDLAG